MTLLVACLALVGCGQGASPAASSDEVVTRANGVASLTITGNDKMKFNVVAFTVRSGEKVRLTFSNIGSMPVITMGHDLAILKQGVNYKQFASYVQAQGGPDPAGKLSPELVEKTITFSRLLGPGESEVLEFTAPSPGAYPYVCTFPSHFAFMHGVMTVE
jgi:azurin